MPGAAPPGPGQVEGGGERELGRFRFPGLLKVPLGIGLGPFGEALFVAGDAFLAVLIVDDIDFGIAGFDSKLTVWAGKDWILL